MSQYAVDQMVERVVIGWTNHLIDIGAKFINPPASMEDEYRKWFKETQKPILNSKFAGEDDVNLLKKRIENIQTDLDNIRRKHGRMKEWIEEQLERVNSEKIDDSLGFKAAKGGQKTILLRLLDYMKKHI